MRVGSEYPGLNSGDEPQDEVSRGAAEAEGEGLASGACQLIQPKDVCQGAALDGQHLSVVWSRSFASSCNHAACQECKPSHFS